MSSLIFKDVELPDALCQVIRRLSLRSVGYYNGEEHRFLNPVLDPTTNAMLQMRAECEGYDRLSDLEPQEVIVHVIKNTSVEPYKRSVNSLSIGSGNVDALKKLQHIVLRESSGAETELLYLDRNRFLVLRTGRSAIIPGDILQANSLPIKIGDYANFSIFRDEKEFVPEILAQYETSFKMPAIASIVLLSTPDLYRIIDEDERFGGVVLTVDRRRLVEGRVKSLVGEIKSRVDKIGDENLPNDEVFPGYEELLKLSKTDGIDCYTLNLLIECYERREPFEYNYVEEDWLVVKTTEQLAAEQQELHRKRLAQYRGLKKNFNNEISKIRTRRVMIFFKAAGRVPDMEYMKKLEAALDEVAEFGPDYGTKGWAKATLSDAIANSKPKNGENLLIAAKLIGAILVISFVGWTWFTTNRSLEAFNYKLEVADGILESGDYEGAQAAYRQAYDDFRPKITAMFAQGPMKKRIAALNEALEKEITNGIEQISAMRLADDGKFSKASEELLFRLMKLSPKDSRILELKEAWMNQ